MTRGRSAHTWYRHTFSQIFSIQWLSLKMQESQMCMFNWIVSFLRGNASIFIYM